MFPRPPPGSTPSAFCHRGRFVSQLRNDPQLLAYSPCPLPASSGTSFLDPLLWAERKPAISGIASPRATSLPYRTFLCSICAGTSRVAQSFVLSRASRSASLLPAGHCERHRPRSRATLAPYPVDLPPPFAPRSGGGFICAYARPNGGQFRRRPIVHCRP
jgi:hypothetical protein